LVITIHFINDDWKFEHFVLDVFYLPSSHDALTIKNAVVEVMNNLNIENRLIGITNDNEAKMISATKRIGLELNLQEFQYYHYTAHILNLIVEAALSIGIISELVKKLKTFISIVRNSPKQMDKLKSILKLKMLLLKCHFLIVQLGETIHTI